MSTEFTQPGQTDDTEFVRWSGNSTTGPGTAFEFGTITNLERVLASFDCGITFEPLGAPMADDPTDRASLEALVISGRVTFGEFPVTVEVGSGQSFRFGEEAW